MYALPFSNPILGQLLGDERAECCFDPKTCLRNMQKFEVALTRSLADVGHVSAECASVVVDAIDKHWASGSDLPGATARDGVVVPQLVAEVRNKIPPEFREGFHFGVTSQDLVDTALAMALRELNPDLGNRLRQLIDDLKTLNERFGDLEFVARTRMQDAGQFALRSRIDGWTAPLQRWLDDLDRVRSGIELLQLGGPLGDRSALSRFPDLAGRLAIRLGLSDPGHAWHNQRDGVVAYASWMAGLTGSVGKIGQDCAIMAQQGELRITGAGMSSSIPHKRNPVAAEALVTNARLCATLVSGLQHSLIHEQERSGGAWMLEWIVLPQICVAACASLNSAYRFIGSISGIGKAD